METLLNETQVPQKLQVSLARMPSTVAPSWGRTRVHQGRTPCALSSGVD